MLPPNESCEGMHPVTANFFIEELCEVKGNVHFRTETDTTYADHPVQFTAEEQKAKYKWIINGEEYDKRGVRIVFGEEMIGKTITVSLVVTKKPDLICFPSDDGYDSITKFLHISQKTPTWSNKYADPEWAGTLPLDGIYRVFAPHLKDSLDITFTTNYDLYTGSIWVKTAALLDVDGEGGTIISDARSFYTGARINYHQVKYEGLRSEGMCDFDVRIDTKQVAHISLKMKKFSLKNPDYEYIGRKL